MCVTAHITCDVTFDYVKKYIADTDVESKGPRTDPYGTPYIISEQWIKALLVFALCCLLEEKLSMILRVW